MEVGDVIAGLDRKENTTQPTVPNNGMPNLVLADGVYRFWCPPGKYPTADNKCDSQCSEPYYTDQDTEMCVLCDAENECFNASLKQCQTANYVTFTSPTAYQMPYYVAPYDEVYFKTCSEKCAPVKDSQDRGKQLECTSCMEGQFIGADDKCVSDCPGGIIRVEGANRFCDAECKYGDQYITIGNNKYYVCVECPDDWPTYINAEITKT